MIKTKRLKKLNLLKQKKLNKLVDDKEHAISFITNSSEVATSAAVTASRLRIGTLAIKYPFVRKKYVYLFLLFYLFPLPIWD